MKSLAIRVLKSDCEETMRKLKGLINPALLPKREKNFVYLPVKGVIKGFELVERDFEERRIKPRSYKEIVDLPEELLPLLPTSYDIVGDIALIKLPEELLQYKRKIGNAILEVNSNIKVVCLSKPVKGEYRTRDMEIIAGENRTETLHKEYGLRFYVDVKDVFFSPRLAGERYRIANLVKKGEIIIDMFAGVAPFSIMLARFGSPKIVYAIDKNPKAIELAKRNVVQNKVLDKVEILHGDAREVTKNLVENGAKADRIIMNLPFLAYEFFIDSLLIAKNNCTIHYYDVLKEDEIKNRIQLLKEKAMNTGREIEITGIRKIKTYAPREFYTCFDIRVKTKPA
ncbi:MAG: tRNA (guanine-N1)-methyltransferase [Thermoplasmata archaeon]|nr:MAG: tRNA (guanine-N1)-methyltransferase [Thermoplasmata archaeon]